MFCKREGNTRVLGHLQGPSPETSVLAVVASLERHLVRLVQQKGSAVTSEKHLDRQLFALLTDKEDKECFPFYFRVTPTFRESRHLGKNQCSTERESSHSTRDVRMARGSRTPPGSNREPVIETAFHHNGEAFFCAVSRCLSNISRAREKEYLVGRPVNGKYKDCGGIEGFKKGQLGGNLRYGAMIGYVQAYDFDYWQNRVNAWINNLKEETENFSVNWTPSDILTMQYKTPILAAYRSENSRPGGTIRLYHLWLPKFRFLKNSDAIPRSADHPQNADGERR
ncbi:MAG: hypothetical protein GY765_05920 [bacterium]|nr:hypothetical protein [bacterium]